MFAIDLAGEGDPVEGPLAGRGKFMDLRFAGGLLSAADAGIAATAKAVFEWHRRHGFCSVCGQPSEAAEAGWKRICTACKSEHFPRTDPVTIMLPTFGDSCLLGRQAVWPKGRFSTLAGFMEPGESIEAACAREVKEEAGLTVVEVRYHSSQPWPFPTNLMIGLIVEVSDQNAAPDQTELEEVRWFTREELRRILQAQAQPQGSGGAWGDVEGVGVPPPLRCRAPADGKPGPKAAEASPCKSWTQMRSRRHWQVAKARRPCHRPVAFFLSNPSFDASEGLPSNMSELGFNKVAGAVLATGLAVLGLQQVAGGLYAPDKAAKAGYAIQVAADTSEGAAEPADVPPDWGTVPAHRQCAGGRGQSQKCVSCHTFTKGRPPTAPVPTSGT